MTELPQQNVSEEEEEEGFTDQKLCKQNSSLDQEDIKPPEIKEEQEEEHLVLKQECDTFMLTPTSEENDHNQDETFYLIINRSGVEENPQSFILVESSVASEPHSDHQLLSHNCRVTERRDQVGSKSTDPETTRHAESKTMKNESQSNFGYDCNMSEILRHTRTELPQWHVCKKEEVFTDQQLCKQERNSSLDQEDTKPPEIKEEQNEICCTSQEGEQLALKQETDTVMLTPTYKKSDHSQDESLYSITDQTQSGVEEKLLTDVLVESSAASETNTDHQLLSRNSHVPERQHEDGDKHASSGSANSTEPKPKKNRSYTKCGYNLSEVPHKTDREVSRQSVWKEEEVLVDQQICNKESVSLDQENSDPLEIKEEQEELCTSQEGEHFVLKHETDTLMLNPTYEKRDHSQDQTLRCNNGYNSNLLKIHHNTEIAKKGFLCDICGKDFQHKSKFNVHMRIHTGERPYICNTCGKTFRKSFGLKVHVRTHTGEKPYSCRTCGKTFRQKSGLNAHTRTHTGEKPYSCDICGKTFSDRSAMNVHLRIHTGERPYFCKTCGKTFYDKSRLNAHVRIHTGEQPYPCNTCGKTFSKISGLNAHIRTHTGEKPYSCDICGKKFIDRSKMIAHRRVHTGEKPFSCDICEKTFAERSTLNIHRRIHTGEKPFSCNTCGKEFKHTFGLKSHLRTHTGEKPYSCVTCGKKFSYKSGLKAHLKTHTAGTPVLVTSTGKG